MGSYEYDSPQILLKFSIFVLALSLIKVRELLVLRGVEPKVAKRPLRLFVSTSDDSNLPVTHSLISDDFCIAKKSTFILKICTLIEIFL